MAHRHYHTLALVLGGHNVGESHRYLTLLTREFGMVSAVARSMRLERSKLRFALRDFALLQASLVRGREMWRITGAVLVSDYYHTFKHDQERVAFLVHLTALLRRLLHGEERNEQLFEIVHTALTHLKEPAGGQEVIRDVENLTVLRLLSSLGYQSDKRELSELFGTAPFSGTALTEVATKRREVVAEINRILGTTNL